MDVPDAPLEQEAAPDLAQGEPPSLEELLKAINSMDGLSREEKEDIMRNLLIGPDAGARSAQAGAVPEPAAGYFLQQGNLLLVVMLVVVAFVFVFFLYKLYQALTEKERRREEKRRLKQQRKKK